MYSEKYIYFEIDWIYYKKQTLLYKNKIIYLHNDILILMASSLHMSLGEKIMCKMHHEF